MAEVFDIEKERDSFLSRMVIQATTHLPPARFQEILDLAKASETDKFTVSFTLNGIDLSVREVAKWLEDAFDRCVDERAEEMIQERLQGRLEPITNLLGEFQEKLQEAVRGGV